MSFFRIAIVVLALLLAACGKEPLYQEQGYVFGTLVDVTIYGEDETKAQAALGEVLHEFQRMHDELHAWQLSELSELNVAIAKGEGKVVTPELEAMLQDAARLSAQSQGLFNPTIGGLIQLWGFQSDEFKPQLPDEKKIAALVAANPQMSDIQFLPSPHRGEGAGERGGLSGSTLSPSPSPVHGGGVTVTSRNRAVKLDLGGYAKGYALDNAVALLRKRGIQNALVNIGGNIMALGQHGKRPWRVGIQHPRKSGALASLELHDGEAIGTSGDYQRYFELEGKRYCHLIDPRSGYPVQGVQAVTVMTRGPHAGVLSDVLSKPLFIAGKDGWRNAAQQMGLKEAMMVDGEGNIHLTGALRKRLEFADKNIQLDVSP